VCSDGTCAQKPQACARALGRCRTRERWGLLCAHAFRCFPCISMRGTLCAHRRRARVTRAVPLRNGWRERSRPADPLSKDLGIKQTGPLSKRFRGENIRYAHVPGHHHRRERFYRRKGSSRRAGRTGAVRFAVRHRSRLQWRAVRRGREQRRCASRQQCPQPRLRARDDADRVRAFSSLAPQSAHFGWN
jgi:hypothetical protein